MLKQTIAFLNNPLFTTPSIAWSTFFIPSSQQQNTTGVEKEKNWMNLFGQSKPESWYQHEKHHCSTFLCLVQYVNPLICSMLLFPLFSACFGDEIVELPLDTAQKVILNASFRYYQELLALLWIVIAKANVSSHLKKNNQNKLVSVNSCKV